MEEKRSVIQVVRSYLIHFWNLIFDKGKVGNQPSYLIFLYCLLVSVFIWMILAFNNTYQTKIDIQLRGSKLPPGFVILEEIPKEGQMQIQGNGWDLFWLNFRNDITLEIDLSQVDENGFIDFSNSLAKENPIFELGLQPLSLIPAGVRLRTRKLERKMVPIQFVGQISGEIPFQLVSDPIFFPDSLMVSGSKQVIDTLSSIPIEYYINPSANGSFVEKVQIDKKFLSNNGIISEANSVRMEVLMDKFTSIKKSLPIKIESQFSNSIELANQKVQVELNFPLDNLNDFEASFPLVSVIANIDSNAMQYGLVNLTIRNLPAYIRNYSLTPSYVSIIVKNEE